MPTNIRRHVVVDAQEAPADMPISNDETEKCDNSSSCSLRAAISIFYDPSENTAFFKLQCFVGLLVPSATASVDKTERWPVYLCVRPEQIDSLASDRRPLPQRLNPLYAALSNGETTCLRFALAVPPTLVVPNIDKLVAKSRADLSILQAYQALARRRSFAVYLPSTAIADSLAASLCGAASRPGSLRSSPAQADHRRWFQGCEPGGKVVPVDGVSQVVARESPTASPPSYDELAPTPPSTAQNSSVRRAKRPRGGQHDEGLSGKGTVASPADQAVAVASQLAGLTIEAGRKEASLRQAIAEADQRLGQLADAAAKDPSQLIEQVQLNELKEYIDERLEDARAELRGFIDERLNELDVDVVMKAEMEEYVDDALRAAENDLREKLQGGGLRVLLE